MNSLSLPHLNTLIERVERGEVPLADTTPAPAVLALAHAYAALLKAQGEMDSVADELRKYQKYAVPGKPSLQIVQLRKQQAATKQAALIARQGYAQATHVFLRETGVVVPSRRTPTDFTALWLGKLAAV
jgi:hypothetical protein